MATRRIVFLSDVHIGSNARTNWYQREVHESMLLAFFDHIIANAATTAELVILGDLIDQWTYLPDVRPPSFEEIATANPAIFAKDGALASAARVLPERITYIAGNHDMALTAEALSSWVGQPIRGVSGPLYQPPAGMGQVVCTHGHIYSVFNAPAAAADPKNGLPVGHFITRLAAKDADRKLLPGQTVADLPQSGNPTGLGLLGCAARAVLQEFMGGQEELGAIIIKALLDEVSATDDLPFVLLDGSRITAAQVMSTYADAYEQYCAAATDPVVYGRDPAIEALAGGDARNDLSHFAAVLSAGWPAVVMGHTHIPKDDSDRPLFASDYLYANAGFNCPSRPDSTSPTTPKVATFVELTIDAVNGQLESAVRYIDVRGGKASVAPTPLSPPKTASILGQC